MTTISGASAAACWISSAAAPSTTRRMPMDWCTETRSRWPRNVVPSQASRALGRPMGRDSPAARMMAAIVFILALRGSGLLDLKGFVLRAGGVAAHGHQLRGNAHGDFLRRESADLEADGSIDACELLLRHALFFQRAVNGEDFAAAADHADVPGLGVHG